MVTESPEAKLDSATWVLLAYRLPREPSAPRLALWRAIRRLGAVQIGDGLVALPRSARNLEHLEWLTAGIIEDHGSASVWAAMPTSSRANLELANTSRTAVDLEYRALIAEARTASASVDRVGQRRTLRRLRQRLRQVESRDYFEAPSRAMAGVAIDRLAKVEEGVLR